MERTFPPDNADERTTLVAFLEFFRDSLEMKVEGLNDDDARRANVPPSDLNLMGLIRHMAEVERSWFRRCLNGEDAPPIYYGDAHPGGDRDGDLHPGPNDTLAEALSTWRTEIDHARALVEGRTLDDLADRPTRWGQHPNVRWILVHMIEEYARHCGHADLLREAIDGVTGD